jgi:hypothetical protein
LMDFILNNHFYAAARPSSRVQVEKGMKGKWANIDWLLVILDSGSLRECHSPMTWL